MLLTPQNASAVFVCFQKVLLKRFLSVLVGTIRRHFVL